ncbi:N-acetyl-beta-hexosaminidase [Bifidobacterium actinocoloniiforme DSM 22766]|uniref:N-acetyl-beta-hexosaminidase n=1 Tax=Bifidobacterium actinocoloniiforme DSM 22766 TaxID=1437605 RepID=A0A086Z0R5_9BIFI|nr:glycoside hydrolase family 20 zincin-like fold domain-containing protein [Bifidobacterium actinocoloniiforme]AKV55320.1 hypothetical protein AB656_02690 [Bifidobacterium actinocoloniiforme DSM 22766]KFI40115.1 N-acetyl-beta-hexosaminidase [Bifidobacterium actinocoloniiforme DSM 22766]
MTPHNPAPPTACAPDAGLALIPRPRSLTATGGEFLLPFQGRVCYQGPMDAQSCQTGALLAEQLTDEIEAACSYSWDHAQGCLWSADLTLGLDPSLSKQAYRLTIGGHPAGEGASSAPISLLGGDLDGLRYAVQTLRQILRQTGALLPCLTIEDSPVFPVRSYSLDVTRGRVPTMNCLKGWVDALALCKYNQLQLYVEHAFAFDGMSESWRGCSPLLPQDIIDLDAYCRLQGIELVPSLSTFGHHYVNLRTRTLRRLGEFPEDADRPFSFIERQEHHTLNVAEPDSFAFSTAIIDAYAQLFTSRQFNIGGDETFDLGRGRSKPLADQVGVDKLYADYLTRLCDHLSSQGREPMFWGDIAVSMPAILPRLPKSCLLLNWLYSPRVDDSKVKLVADMGLPQYVCSAVQAWNGLLPRVSDAWSNISRLSAYGQRYGAVGSMVTDWGDYGHINDPVMSLPGMAYSAQCSWDTQGQDQRSCDRAITSLFFADRSGASMAALEHASTCQAFSWSDLVTYLELDDGKGGINQDVSRVVGLIKGQQAWQGADQTGLAGARRRYLEISADSLTAVPQTNDRLSQAARDLASSLKSPAGQPLQLAIEGQRLFNLLGWQLARREGLLADASGAGESEARALAGGLETWFEAYRSRWRKVSREAELRKVATVVWAFADMLRQG